MPDLTSDIPDIVQDALIDLKVSVLMNSSEQAGGTQLSRLMNLAKEIDNDTVQASLSRVKTLIEKHMQ